MQDVQEGLHLAPDKLKSLLPGRVTPACTRCCDNFRRADAHLPNGLLYVILELRELPRRPEIHRSGGTFIACTKSSLIQDNNYLFVRLEE
jgi:hypothetical protein